MTTLQHTHLYREIHEQPNVVRRLLDKEMATAQALADLIHGRGIDHVVIAARGTSDNAGRYAQYVWGAMNGLSVGLAAPSLFSIYHRPPRFGNALVIGISQSGKSPDIVSVLAEARRQGALTAALTNRPTSPLAGEADVVIDLQAGEELAVAATKTYTAELAAVALISAALSGTAEQRDALLTVPEAMEATLAMNDAVAEIAPRYRYMQRCVVVGRGFNLATAFETALKLKEMTYTIVEPYSSADFLHGPLAMIEQGFPVILIAPSGVMAAEMLDFARTLRERQAELIVVSDAADLLDTARVPLKLPVPMPEWLSPITSILPGQMMAMHLAHTRDYNIDAPRGIMKVTETR
ncbi:MAG TPA: SIS domain-containing protein [Promineifilum sp.]|nr:SIS domain-containing protein [Promineifilum sp.]HRO89469.1 SIS domain-containing protein [Promineifilum sp.]HRQ12198.1 SIS domain-containing protein [Promineifilum sp.]